MALASKSIEISSDSQINHVGIEASVLFFFVYGFSLRPFPEHFIEMKLSIIMLVGKFELRVETHRSSTDSFTTWGTTYTKWGSNSQRWETFSNNELPTKLVEVQTHWTCSRERFLKGKALLFSLLEVNAAVYGTYFFFPKQ